MVEEGVSHYIKLFWAASCLCILFQLSMVRGDGISNREKLAWPKSAPLLLPECKSKHLDPTKVNKNQSLQARCDTVCRGHKFVIVPTYSGRGNRPKLLFIGKDGKYLTMKIFVTEVQLALRGQVTQQKNMQIKASVWLLCSYNSR